MDFYKFLAEFRWMTLEGPDILSSSSVMAIYDASFAQNRWCSALDAFIDNTRAQAVLMYDFDALRPLKYSRQAVDSEFAKQNSIIAAYNKMLASGETSNSDLEAFQYLQGQPPYSSVLDEEIWKLDEAFRQRPEIAFTIEKVGVFRRFLVPLSDDPSLKSGVIALYPKQLSSAPPQIDRKRMEILAPHLGKALEINRITQALRFRYNAALAALDMIDLAICLLDSQGRILLKNRRAQDLLLERDGIWEDRTGRLHCRSDEVLGALQQAIIAACKIAEGEDQNPTQEVDIPRSSSSVPLYAVTSALRDADMELEPGLTGAFLTIIDGNRAVDLQIDRVSKAYGFTKAEARVAALVAFGLSNREISERVEVGVETVKTHVASILSKSRSRNRLAFVWRLFQFSPPLL